MSPCVHSISLVSLCTCLQDGGAFSNPAPDLPGSFCLHPSVTVTGPLALLVLGSFDVREPELALPACNLEISISPPMASACQPCPEFGRLCPSSSPVDLLHGCLVWSTTLAPPSLCLSHSPLQLEPGASSGECSAQCLSRCSLEGT
jgi:hypothetical protein